MKVSEPESIIKMQNKNPDLYSKLVLKIDSRLINDLVVGKTCSCDSFI